MDDFIFRTAPKRLLVTGVDGTLGANLAASLADRLDVVGLFEDHPVSLPGCHTEPWDPNDAGAICTLVRREAFDWIIHCGSLSRGSWDMPEQFSGSQEARTCSLLVQAASEAGSRLTVISTDAVFAGPRLFHDERAAATNSHSFARAALEAELALESTDALIVRTHAYGWSPAGASPGFAERVWQDVVEGTSACYDPHQYATPILADDLAELLWLAYRRGLTGMYHITGAERTSAYRFAVELATAFGLAGYDPGVEAEGSLASDHLHETSLNTRLARRELEHPMPMLREGLDRFAQQAAEGFRARLRCSWRPSIATADAA